MAYLKWDMPFFLIFIEKSPRKACHFDKKLYLCTRFRK